MITEAELIISTFSASCVAKKKPIRLKSTKRQQQC